MARRNVPALLCTGFAAVAASLGSLALYAETLPHTHAVTAMGLCVLPTAALGMAACAMGGLFMAHCERAYRRPVVRWNRYRRPLYQRFITARTLDEARAFVRLNRKGR